MIPYPVKLAKKTNFSLFILKKFINMTNMLNMKFDLL